MSTYKWRRQPTKYFGDTWVPYVEIHLQRHDGGFEALSIQADTGAVISLLRRSVADLLGLDFARGREVELGAVGGMPVKARVHEIQTRFGTDSRILPGPFAIAESEQVPNLLGRRAFVDAFQFHFDPTLEETRVTAQWMEKADRECYERLVKIEAHVLGRWHSHPLPKPADFALTKLLNRADQLLAGVLGLAQMHRSFETPALIRGLFEIGIQIEYLLKDPAPRAQDFVDYFHVARWKRIRSLCDNPDSFIARHLAYSPRRITLEGDARREFERVKAKFTRSKDGREAIASNWYRMPVRELARAVGREPEYKVWYQLCSGWLHGDPFDTRDSYPFRPATALVTSICMHGRILRTIVDAKQVVMEASDYDFLQECEKGVV